MPETLATLSLVWKILAALSLILSILKNFFGFDPPWRLMKQSNKKWNEKRLETISEQGFSEKSKYRRDRRLLFGLYCLAVWTFSHSFGDLSAFAAYWVGGAAFMFLQMVASGGAAIAFSSAVGCHTTASAYGIGELQKKLCKTLGIPDKT